MKGNIHGYPSIYNLGHAALGQLFDGVVVVEEKVDGSQFSFGRADGELFCRSKGKDQSPGQADKMFQLAVDQVLDLDLREGLVYRGEYLQKPKHNTIAYDRVPVRNIVLFDIQSGDEQYLDPDQKSSEAARIGLEVVPVMAFEEVSNWETLQVFLDRESFLGGAQVEGIVIKNYARFGPDKKALMGKFVSEAFKEKHNKEWKKSNPTARDIVDQLSINLTTEARWQKAIQHLRDNGELEGSPRDIGPLIKAIQEDVREEEREYIRDTLYNYAMGHIERKVVVGFPQWYKEQLAQEAFA